MRNLLIGFVVAFLAIGVVGYFYLAGGYAPVATASSPLPFEATIAHMALDAVVNKEAPKNTPMPADEASFAAGAKIYRQNCAVCHGLPGQSETAIAQGMFPKVPQLFKGKGVTDDPAGVTYWKAAHGIRLSGMPGFEGTLSDAELWQVSLMLANADKLPPVVQSMLSAPLSPI